MPVNDRTSQGDGKSREGLRIGNRWQAIGNGWQHPSAGSSFQSVMQQKANRLSARPMRAGKGEMVRVTETSLVAGHSTRLRVRAHRVTGDGYGTANPIRSKTK